MATVHNTKRGSRACWIPWIVRQTVQSCALFDFGRRNRRHGFAGRRGWLLGVAGLAHARASFEIRNFSAGQATIMNKIFADTASSPTSTQYRMIAVQAFPAHSAGFRFDSKEQRLPFASSISNTHMRDSILRL